MRAHRFISPYGWLFIVVLVCHLAYLASTFPGAEEYRPAADEGTYFRDASTILDRGLPGFRQLGQEFLGDPSLQTNPPPIRIGHLLTAAVVLSIDRSFRALSVLSTVCHGLLAVVVFVFVRRLWNEPAAFASGVLVALSPLGSGLAGRALLDTHSCLFVTLSVFAFLEWATSGRMRHFVCFVLALTWALLVRETTFFLLPYFFGAIIVMRLAGSNRAEWRHLVLLALAPLSTGVIYVALFGGVTPVVAMGVAMRKMTSPGMNAYVQAYNSGPWFEFLIDSLLSSPITSVAFLLYCGWYAGSPRKTLPTSLMLAFFWCGLTCLSWLPQNPRYTLALDPVVRVGAGLLVAAIFAGQTQRAIRAAAAGVCFLAMAGTDVSAFHTMFVVDRVYDPVAYNLAASRNLFPSAIHAARPPMTAEAYLQVSVAYYRARDFDAAIQMSERALALAPSNADAFNNIGASHCERGRWLEATAALEQALRLRPAFPLARNNLAWAKAGARELIAERRR